MEHSTRLTRLASVIEQGDASGILGGEAISDVCTLAEVGCITDLMHRGMHHRHHRHHRVGCDQDDFRRKTRAGQRGGSRRPWSPVFHCLLMLLALPVVGCAPHLLLLPHEESGPSQEEYLIGAGDVLSIKFFFAPELNEDVSVRPDGSIALQLVGDVQVSNRTSKAAAVELRERYEPHVERPEVAVIVRDFGSQRAYVGGEVRLPGVVRLDGNTSLADAVFSSGGTLDTAELKSVILVRVGENGREAYSVDLKAGLRGEAEIPILQRYDIVYVPKSFIAEVGTYVELYINRIVPRNALFVAQHTY